MPATFENWWPLACNGQANKKVASVWRDRGKQALSMSAVFISALFPTMPLIPYR
jgi:hypothetical protein